MTAEEQQSDSDSDDDQDTTVGKSGPLSLVARVGITVLVIAHLMAVVLPPLSVQTNGPFGASPSVGTLLQSVEGYSQFTYMNQGYAFFAPDPGPSHLIQAAVFESDDRRTESLYPNLDNQWPRLLYHRHFMLAEFLTAIYTEQGPPQELIDENPDAAFAWERARGRYENVRQSITDHLKHVNRGKHVVIRRIEHVIPSFLEFVNDSIALDDPELYIVLLDPSPDAPRGPPEDIPAPVSEPTDDQRLQPPQLGPLIDPIIQSADEPKDPPADAPVRPPVDETSDDAKPEAPAKRGDSESEKGTQQEHPGGEDDPGDTNTTTDKEASDKEPSDKETPDESSDAKDSDHKDVDDSKDASETDGDQTVAAGSDATEGVE